jgi:putative membrane protein
MKAKLAPPAVIDDDEDPDLVSVELSARRTGMSFQRTRMSADRTLMSVIRTSLSLISFGFTIYQFFQHLQEKSLWSGSSHAARNFGAALVYLGVGMVVVGIVYHLQFMRGLRRERRTLTAQGLIHSQSTFPVSFTLLVALALLFVGLAAIASVTLNIGPFD